MNVLVIDVGGSHVKLRATGAAEQRQFESGPRLSPPALVSTAREVTRDWAYDAISLGLPALVSANAASGEPGNLGDGWIEFDFAQAFGRPVRIVNDAVMQALGGYEGGRMLFLGLGTGLGSALISEHVVVPLELGNLPFGERETVADRLGRKGLEANGRRRWRQDVEEMTRVLRGAFSTDYVLLGGGHAGLVDPLPHGTRRGSNEDAFIGGFRLWEDRVERHDRQSPSAWRVVR